MAETIKAIDAERDNEFSMTRSHGRPNNCSPQDYVKPPLKYKYL
jgi:hypothetical protein